MSDLIKARKGIFIPDITVEMFRNASLEAVEELLVSGEMQDIILPSAEPKRLTDDDFETIRIHLNAYKENLCNQQRWKEAEEYQRIIDRFMAFVSAQPDSQPTCNNLATDTISRQVAINAVNKIAPVNTEYDCTLLDILDVRYVLTELPSAEPETKPISYMECANAMLKMWIDNVLTDGEYNRIMEKLNSKHMTDMRGEQREEK